MKRMDFSRLARWFEKKDVVAPKIPVGTRLYVIGDLHGRLDLLNELEQQIKQDLETAPVNVLTIFLGDYIDRGRESAGVLERLSAEDFCTPICTLRGNHEEVFLQFLSDASVLGSWRNFGGLETLAFLWRQCCRADARQQATSTRRPRWSIRFLLATDNFLRERD